MEKLWGFFALCIIAGVFVAALNAAMCYGAYLLLVWAGVAPSTAMIIAVIMFFFGGAVSRAFGSK